MTVLMLALCPLLAAANITYTISGTLGPVLAGSDPLGANGESGVLTIVASNSLTPTGHTSTTSTYSLPAGSISVVIGGVPYGTVGTSTMKYSFPASGPATLIVSAKISVDGISGTVVGTASLANGSFPKSVLKHPAPFSPTPQNLTAARKAGGPGSQVKYTVLGLSTTLGLSGTASN